MNITQKISACISGPEFKILLCQNGYLLHFHRALNVTLQSVLLLYMLTQIGCKKLMNRLMLFVLLSLSLTLSTVMWFQQLVWRYKIGWWAVFVLFLYAVLYNVRPHKNATVVLKQNWLYTFFTAMKLVYIKMRCWNFPAECFWVIWA